MGSTQSLFTSQNFVAAILVPVVLSIVYSSVKKTGPTIATSDTTGKATPGSKKGKKARRADDTQDVSGDSSEKGKEKQGSLADISTGASVEHSIPGGLAHEPQPQGSKPVREKKRKAKKTVAASPSHENNETSPATAGSSTSAGTRPQSQKRVPAGTTNEESWTRVESRRRSSGQNAGTSDAGVTTSSVTEDGSSSGTMEKNEDRGTPRPRRTLAEKMLPKGRATVVDDMLESSQYPEVSRVMRVTSGGSEKSASGPPWRDYENVEDTRDVDADGEDDGGWGIVKSRGKAKHNQSSSSTGAIPQAKAPETLTKKQRQHAAKRDAAKTAKAEAEAERLAQLARHKNEQERTRIAEQYSHKGGQGPRSNVSGGMSATVNDKGQLVWE